MTDILISKKSKQNTNYKSVKIVNSYETLNEATTPLIKLTYL